MQNQHTHKQHIKHNNIMSTETTKTDTYIHLTIAIFTHYFTQANRTHIITEHINDFQKHRLESIF